MKNYILKALDLFFEEKILDKAKAERLIEKRKFYNQKEQFFSLLPYKNQMIKEAIIGLKFKNHQKNAEIFGELLFDNLVDFLEEWEIRENFYKPILVVVPISFWRKIKRGYNQNDLIIESFMKSGGKNFLKWEKNVLRKKNRKPQSLTKNKNERLKNQKNAYTIIQPWKIKNKNIILFDDIYTTGATISEVKKVLKKAGAKKIKVIVLAH